MEKYPKTPIRISSKTALDREMKRVLHFLTKNTENDQTWELFGIALTNIKTWALEDKAHEYEGFVDHIKQLQRPIIASLSTERTKLLRITTDMLKGLSQAMQRDYELLQDLFTPTLIRLFARTNKTSLAQYLDCFTTLIDNAKMPKVILRLSRVLNSRQEPSKSVRENVAACLERVILANSAEDLQPYITHIENAIRTAAMDPSPDVRAKIRACFNAYKQKMLDAASKFENTLPDDIKKYLNVQSRPTIPSRSRLMNRARATTRPTPSTNLSMRPTVSRSAAQPSLQKRVAIKSPARHSDPQLLARLPVRLPVRPSSLSAANFINKPVSSISSPRPSSKTSYATKAVAKPISSNNTTAATEPIVAEVTAEPATSKAAEAVTEAMFSNVTKVVTEPSFSNATKIVVESTSSSSTKVIAGSKSSSTATILTDPRLSRTTNVSHGPTSSHPTSGVAGSAFSSTTKTLTQSASSSQPPRDTKPVGTAARTERTKQKKANSADSDYTDKFKEALTRALKGNPKPANTTRRILPMKKPFMLTGMPAMRGTKRKAPSVLDENEEPSKKRSTS